MAKKFKEKLSIEQISEGIALALDNARAL